MKESFHFKSIWTYLYPDLKRDLSVPVLKSIWTYLYHDLKWDLWDISVPIFRSKQSTLPIASRTSLFLQLPLHFQYQIGLLLSVTQVKSDVSIWDLSPKYLFRYRYQVKSQVKSHCLHVQVDPSASGISSYNPVSNIKLVDHPTIYTVKS